jgi:hypothetical protein
VIRDDGISMYDAANVVTQQETKAEAESAAGERRKKQDSSMQRCFAELLCLFPNAAAMLEAYRSSLISKCASLFLIRGASVLT